MKIKVIDGFSFFNEVEMLKLRLNYLNEVVDYFVISECKYTHSGNPKPYYLDEVLEELPEDIRNKIVRLKYEPDISNFNFPKNLTKCDFSSGHWELERNQRNLITESLSQFFPNDLLMISDLDEIPKKEVVEEYKEIFENYVGKTLQKDFCAVTKCKMFYYNFNTFINENWPGTCFSTIETALNQSSVSLYHQRGNFFPIEDGGWHFSTFGTVERIKTKIQSFAHQEYNKDQYLDEGNILKSIQNKEDIYHNHSTTFREYDSSNFPKNLRENIINYFSKEMY